ncbi:MAG: hypothetical protein GY812_06740 [Actinomycetia bacterium]|nr:hypothetical protein [Actinomycetes bacterium]
MRRSRAVPTAVASVVAFAVLAASCASVADTGEVSAASGRYGASLETSTTIPDLDGNSALNGALPGGRRAAATENLLTAIAENPGILDNLEDLTPEQLEELTGLQSDELGTLGITPATVAALGGVLNQIGADEEDAIDPETAALLAAGGGELLTSTGELTDEAAALLGTLNIDPVTLAALVATAVTVPDSVNSQLGTLLEIIDPNGLGQLSEDNGALSVLAVLTGALLGRDPVALGQLANAGDLDPRFRGLLTWVANLATTLRPELVDRLNNITRILGPFAIRGIGAAIGLLERPAVGALFEEAFQDPEVVATSLGSALLLIPGLGELIAPQTFNDPNAIYGAVGGLAAVALLNNDAPGFKEFLDTIGVEIPPEFYD